MLKKVFIVSKIKNTFLWRYVINHVNGEEIIETFYEKEVQKTNQQEFRIEKVIKRKKVVNYISNGKVMIIHLIAGLMKKIWRDSINCNFIV